MYTMGKVRTAAAAAAAATKAPPPANRASASSPGTRAAARRALIRSSLISVTRRSVVSRADPGDDLPQIGIALDQRAHRWHRPHDVLQRLPLIPVRHELGRPERDEAKESVVAAAVYPHTIDERWAHAAAAVAAVTAVAAVLEEQLVAGLRHCGIAGEGIVERPLGGGRDDLQRRLARDRRALRGGRACGRGGRCREKPTARSEQRQSGNGYACEASHHHYSGCLRIP